MLSRQGNMLRSLRDVEDFLAKNAATLDGVVKTGTRKKLAQAIAALESTVAEQAGTGVISRSATNRYLALRQALIRDHMTPIARIARILRAELPPTPEMHALRMPRLNWKMERLAAAAHGMAQGAAPYRADFVDAGLDSDFIEQLTVAANAMVRSVSDRNTTRGQQTGATKGLATTLASGRKLVDAIDALVTSELANNPALLANWKRVKRVPRIAVHPKDKPTPTPALLPPGATVPVTTISARAVPVAAH
jgi:hypothetical protein